MSNRCTKLIVAAIPPILIGLFPAAALAHPGHASTGSGAFAAGLLHPLNGADHLSALLLAGGWAAFQGARQELRLPALMLATMAAGFLVGPSLGSILAEALIALSVVALAGAGALRLRPPLALVLLAFALFGFGHGLAHGIESNGGPVGFMIGMLATSTTLLAFGAIAGSMLNRRFPFLPARD